MLLVGLVLLAAAGGVLAGNGGGLSDEPYFARIVDAFYSQADVDRPGPDLFGTSDVMVGARGELEEFYLDTPALARQVVATVFTASADSLPDPIIVKYVVNCYELHHAVPPSVREILFQSLAARMGVAPELLDYSSAGKVPSKRTSAKTDFRMNSRELDACSKVKNAEIRYLVSEHAGESIQQHFADWPKHEDSVDRFRSILLDAISTIELLRKLHAHGVLHLDVHGGNVLRRERDNELVYKLIDFEKAMLVKDAATRFENAPAATEEDRGHFHASPFMDKKPYVPAYRDDMFAVLWMVATEAQGPTEFVRQYYTLPLRKREVLKMKSDFFAVMQGGPLGSIRRTHPQVYRQVHGLLGLALKSVRRMGSEDTPQYDELIAIFTKIIMILTTGDYNASRTYTTQQ